MVGDEARHAGMEREGADAQPVELVPARLQHADRLVHRRRGRAEIDHAVFGRLLRVGLQRPRHQVLRGLELAQQPLHVVGVGRAFLGVARVAVARRAAGEERALGRMRAGIGAVRDAVAVDVEIAAEVAAVVEHLGGHHLAAVVLLAVVPLQRAAQPVVHADVEVEHQEDRGLQPLGEIERTAPPTRSLRPGLPGTAARAWCRRARRRRRRSGRTAGCGSACRSRGRRAARS